LNADFDFKKVSRIAGTSWRGVAQKALGLVGILGLAAAGALYAAPQGATSTATAHKAPPMKAVAMSAPVKTYGSKSAPLTIELFTDYECPICQVFYEQTLRQLIENYVAAGKVYVIHHDFPLAMHQYSGEAARWSDAAATVGQFDAAEAALYDNQAAWTADGNIAKFMAQAMPKTAFDRVEAIMKDCTTPAPQLTTPGADPLARSGHGCPVDPYIAQDIKLGESDGVNATPTYVILRNGQKITQGSGNVSWPILKQVFDTLLAH
jgi:protein-disulfide isomerase